MFYISDYFPEGRFVRWKEYSLVECSRNADKNARVVSMCRGGVFRMSACNKIFERKFLQENCLSFENFLVSEDTPWFANLMTRARNWRCMNVFGYAYRQAREGSITNEMSRSALSRRVEGVCRGIDELVQPQSRGGHAQGIQHGVEGGHVPVQVPGEGGHALDELRDEH